MIYLFLQAPQASDMVCNSVQVFTQILPSSPFTFIGLINDVIQSLPAFTQPILASLVMNLMEVLGLVIFYKMVKIIPTPW